MKNAWQIELKTMGDRDEDMDYLDYFKLENKRVSFIHSFTGHCGSRNCSRHQKG